MVSKKQAVAEGALILIAAPQGRHNLKTGN